jgi:hypothetical protein
VRDETIRCDPPATPTADVFERIAVGEITLQPGPAILKAEVIEASGDELMRLNRLFLRRIE